MNNKLLIFFLMLVAACNSVSKSKVNSKDLSKLLSEPNVQILDVRTADEFKQGHIDKSINIDINHPKFDSLISVLYSSLPVYIVANSTENGEQGVTRMNILGFRQASYLDGAIKSWTDNGFELVQDKPKVVYESDTIPFLEARKGSKLVMVDFNATWCKPCKMLEPAVTKVHDELAKDVIVYSIDTDVNPDLAREYQANSIPLLVFIKNGVEVHRSVGLISEPELFALVEKYK
ncbi:MAG: thioredoxin fold domain-containing protein [Bacteroidia bacterium]|nr:thioredoxin fold domain-containing protein [Bacteroidia bacterium]